MKEAFITGIKGHDGSYLAELVLEKGYEVHGIKRRTSFFNTVRIDHHLYQSPNEGAVHFKLHYGGLSDATNLIRIVQQVRPDEIYNPAEAGQKLGWQAKISFEEMTAEMAQNDLKAAENDKIIRDKGYKIYNMVND